MASCPALNCTLDARHHGPHVDASTPLAMHWWNEHNAWPGHNPHSCAECGAHEDLEVERLAAGGALRPRQTAPKWLRESRPPQARPAHIRGAAFPVGNRRIPA